MCWKCPEGSLHTVVCTTGLGRLGASVHHLWCSLIKHSTVQHFNTRCGDRLPAVCYHASSAFRTCSVNTSATRVHLQGFRTKEEVQRFADLMEEMCTIVATKHSGEPCGSICSVACSLRLLGLSHAYWWHGW